MIIKKTEENNIVHALYSSSTICGSSYDKIKNDLTITFKNGGQYLYDSVSKGDYLRFEIDDSQGKVLNSHIKKYSFTKLGVVDTSLIVKEIEEIEKADAKVDAKVDTKVDTKTNTSDKTIFKLMYSMIGDYILENKFKSEDLNELKKIL